MDSLADRIMMSAIFSVDAERNEETKCQGKVRSPEWPKVRAAWLKDHPACRACGDKAMVEVHHKRPFHLYPELELNPSNLITLCEKPGHCCHFREGHGYDWSLFNSDVEVTADTSLQQVKMIRGPKS